MSRKNSKQDEDRAVGSSWPFVMVQKTFTLPSMAGEHGHIYRDQAIEELQWAVHVSDAESKAMAEIQSQRLIKQRGIPQTVHAPVWPMISADRVKMRVFDSGPSGARCVFFVGLDS
jgi:hypothetical protein